ncbi:MAG: hypothetical protein R1F54_07285 [Candidatus Zeuxoniibacter abyssi]|nr:MAG: hypothetical protein R1F54_07285 [Candidatus Persebacteraceae bacterium AB1(2)]
MKITKVIIRNFKHFQETEFVVSGDNVIVAGQVFFPCTGAWEKIKNALRLKFDDNVWQHLADDTSEPFVMGENKQIAVKVIDDRGNERMVTKKQEEAK